MLKGGIEVNSDAISENLVVYMLHSQEKRLYYYQESELGSERVGLNFVTTVDDRATALEVKTGKKKDVKSVNKSVRSLKSTRWYSRPGISSLMTRALDTIPCSL